MPITQICNISIKLSHFPKDCKVAKLKPLRKNGTKTDRKNFRSKFYELFMNYLLENNILCRFNSRHGLKTV